MEDNTIKFDEDARASRELSNDHTKILTLPAELRNRIYAFVAEIETDDSFNTDFDLLPNTGILKTCRKLRHEATAVIYGQNIMFLGLVGVWKGPPFLNILSTYALSCLRHLCFSFALRGPCVPTKRKSTEVHSVTVTIDHNAHGAFRYEIECYNLGKYEIGKIHEHVDGKVNCVEDLEKCVVAKHLCGKIVPVLDRLHMNEGTAGSQKEDLLALLETLKDLQTLQRNA